MDDRLPLPLTIDPALPQPQLHQLVSQLTGAIRSGQLIAGARLPPSRVLARQLAIGRDTVVQAYAELVAQGWLAAKGRRGTFVAEPMRARTATALEHLAPPRVVRRLTAPPALSVAPHADWRLGQTCAVQLPLAVWRAACKEAGRYLPPNGYGNPFGDEGLRTEIAIWLQRKRGMHVQPAQIVVTQGAGQALDLLSQLLLRKGDCCAVENPGYVRAAQRFAAHGAHIIPMPMDAQGADVHTAFCARAKPLLVHVTAARHYPLGVCMSGQRRQQLLALARKHGSLIIENEYDHEFDALGTAPLPLFAMAPEQVLLLGTFARAISPALRLGFVVAPQAIAIRLADLVEAQQRHTSWPIQRSVAWLMRTGELDKHLRRLQRHLAGLRTRIQQGMEGLAGLGMAMDSAAGGLHCAVKLRTPRANAQWEARLRSAGIHLDTMRSFTLAPTAHEGVFLGYGHMNTDDLQQALLVLEKSMHSANR